jgi:hypothetical protein
MTMESFILIQALLFGVKKLGTAIATVAPPSDSAIMIKDARMERKQFGRNVAHQMPLPPLSIVQDF